MSELIRIRKKYEDLLFYGPFNDTLGAAVHGDADIRYSVFLASQASDSSRACVVVNFGDAPESVELNFEGASRVVIARPFETHVEARLPLRLSISPHQLAVVVKR